LNGLTKSDASEGFNQIIDFLNASLIQKKVLITKDTVRDALRLDDAESIDCLPNKEIFTKTTWSEFSSSMASAVICLAAGKRFFGVETPLFEGMLVPQQAATDVDNVVADDVVADDVPADVEPTLPSPPPTTTPPPPKELPSTSQDDVEELAELQKVIKVVTTAKLLTEVVIAATTTITVVAPITTAKITTASTAARRRKGKAQIEHDEAYARELEAEINKNINWDDVIEQYFNSNVAFLEKSKEQLEEEESRALKRQSESLEEKAAKKQKLDEEATPLALKVLVVDYAIYIENNKPYYKIIRANGSHQLFLSILSLLRNFDREDLEVIWQLVKERFASSKPKNFSNDFLLTTLTYMFEKPDVEAQVWKNQRSVYGLAKVKSWRLLESCVVHIITFITTQMILLVERKYTLTRFTLKLMLNNVGLEVKEESKVSLELLKFVRQQQQEGHRPE
nr:hypothetical protein [Tanacetum cinerariifolium]